VGVAQPSREDPAHAGDASGQRLHDLHIGALTPKEWGLRWALASNATKPDLVAVHKDASSFTVENQVTANSPIPWHPGAVKFFKEHGAKM